MNIGNILRECRLQLGLTQAEISENILTPSYYSKIERNAHRITAEDLLKILNKHSIDISEFINRINNSNPNDIDFFHIINYEMTLYHYQSNVEALKKINLKIKENQTLTSFESQLLIALNDSLIYSLTYDKNFLSEQNIQFLKNQFFEVEEWNNFKLTLYTNIMGMYDIYANHSIIGSLLNKKIEDYTPDHQILIFNILINFISMCLLNDSLLLARHYNNIILKVPTNYDNILQKIIARFHDYLFIFLDNPSFENEKKALAFISVFKEIDFGMYDQSIELFKNTKKLYTE